MSDECRPGMPATAERSRQGKSAGKAGEPGVGSDDALRAWDNTFHAADPELALAKAQPPEMLELRRAILCCGCDLLYDVARPYCPRCTSSKGLAVSRIIAPLFGRLGQ